MRRPSVDRIGLGKGGVSVTAESVGERKTKEHTAKHAWGLEWARQVALCRFAEDVDGYEFCVI